MEELPSLSSCLGEFRSAVSRIRQVGPCWIPASSQAGEQVACIHAMLAALHDAATSQTGWVVHPALAADFERGLDALKDLHNRQQQQQQQQQRQPRRRRAASPDYDSDGSGGYKGFGRADSSGSMPSDASESPMQGGPREGPGSGLQEPLQAAQQALSLCVVHYCDSLRAELAKLQARAAQVEQVEEELVQLAGQRSDLLAKQATLEAELARLGEMLELYQHALQEATAYEADVAAAAAEAGLDVWGATGIPNPMLLEEESMLPEDEAGLDGAGYAGLHADADGDMGVGGGGGEGSGMQVAAGALEGAAPATALQEPPQGQQEGRGEGGRGAWAGVGEESSFVSTPRSGGPSPGLSSTEASASGTPSPLAPLAPPARPPGTDPKQPPPLHKASSGWVRGQGAVKPLALGSLRLAGSGREDALGLASALRARTFREGSSSNAFPAAGSDAAAARAPTALRARTFREGASASVDVSGITDLLPGGFQPNSVAELLGAYRRCASTQRASAPVSMRSSRAVPLPNVPNPAGPLPSFPTPAAPFPNMLNDPNYPTVPNSTAVPSMEAQQHTEGSSGEAVALEPQQQGGFEFPQRQEESGLGGFGVTPVSGSRRNRSRLAGSMEGLGVPLLQDEPPSPTWTPPPALERDQAQPAFGAAGLPGFDASIAAGAEADELPRSLLAQVTFKTGVATQGPGATARGAEPRATNDLLDTIPPLPSPAALGTTPIKSHAAMSGTSLPASSTVYVGVAPPSDTAPGTTTAAAAGRAQLPATACWLPDDRHAPQLPAGTGGDALPPAIPQAQAAGGSVAMGSSPMAAVQELAKGMQQVVGGYARMACAAVGLMLAVLRAPLWLLGCGRSQHQQDSQLAT